MNGKLFVYDPKKKLTAFESAKEDSNLCFVLIGGLTDGILSLPFAKRLSEFCEEMQYSFIQITLSSSNSGFGYSSLKDDGLEIKTCLEYLYGQYPLRRFILIGHSTGCQDVITYLKHFHEDRIPILFAVLQAGVSDREYFSTVDANFSKKYLHFAQTLINDGKGNELMPRAAELIRGCPITAYRYVSLMSVNGDDDFFSLDLPIDYQSRFFRLTVPLAVVLSGKDEYLPSSITAQMLAEKYRNFEQIRHIEIIEGADHGLSNAEDQEIFINLLSNFLKYYQ